ncbi:hypothetical protein HZS38_17100 [Xenorhabdus nematophila]|uniref:DUF6687 family protein n=1 Tax=Xenorhabdus nematophila TaxID=628 RepID=UPI0005430591|nr:DUF6687 family protein [Xenorhabdus nematophila]CEF28970.1 conserved hypothetical protein [Xenorhabdus nematophila str. Websteri]AYA42047.1 hypothetical protein D3790_17760 [Xenorhabdus nematophila]KHD28244.1 hypothetical protein LH67_12010 [Xenorhabdus nematophila]MBA0020768.1 hypothetical protein [Xenorhabdus nematophila]MCB4426571.1 hypothetical protein [Xenorhabdus nematophila]
MINSLPLHDGDNLVQVDNDVAARLDGVELRLLANRVISLHNNQFLDLQNIIAGGGTITRNGNPYDLRRQNLVVQYYNFGCHGEIELREPVADNTRFAVFTPKVTEANSSSSIQEVRLSPSSRLAFLPFEETRHLPNIAADAIHNTATQLTLSHWPANRTPERYKANLSTESVMRFLSDKPEYPADARYVTTDHFDLDGLASVYSLLTPEHALNHKQLLIDIGQFDDFARGHNPKARRLAFALNTIAAQTPLAEGVSPYDSLHVATLFSGLLPAMRDLLDAPVIRDELWCDAEQNHMQTEALLDSPKVTIEQYPDIDLAVFRLPASDVPYSPVPQRYFGLSPISFHNRTPLSTIALVTQDDIVVHQRYEGWVELQSAVPRPRRDLSILARALQSAETKGCLWYYDGVQYIMPLFGRNGTQPTSLPIETILHELKHFLAIAPAAWLSSVYVGP